MSRDFLFEIPIQTRTKRIWFLNAKFPPGFEAKGFSLPRHEPYWLALA